MGLARGFSGVRRGLVALAGLALGGAVALTIPTAFVEALPPGPGPRITADARTNQILVGGTSGEMQAVLKLILDVPVAGTATQSPATTSMRVQVIPVRNARVGHLHEIVQMIANNLPAWNTAEGHRPAIVLDDARSQLVVAGTQKALEEIRALVEALDVAPVAK